MRVSIKLRFEKPLILPLHYHHIIQAVVLKWLNDENYSKFIHNTGYEYNNRKFKMYTFSRLEGKFIIDKHNKTITYFDEANLLVSTADDEFLKYLVNNILINSDFNILGNEVLIDQIKLIHPDIKTKGRFRTKSPIVVYSTFEHNGNKKTYYYNPMENEFEQLIRDNLIKKYIAFYNIEPSDTSFKLVPIKNKNLKENIILYKGIVIKGWSGEFDIEGSEELIKIAYDAGLGSKNSQGFGCIELI
ncbi:MULTISPECIES: CRISPR-associated endoribonuclease Cas6 [Tepidibacillus]|uniref:CRISPR-associated endoribonuclease n=1 Tax=Tepidibacillus decaturensis TaxID=1413211 RepID=A0A135L254_9BACI|nr:MULTISPECIES: CRISPR-associated endoribonuclease Cas6 [Tepidibacillus]KXG43091.1 CRISPR-associated protein [Tepidibacillus decaturensis]GBF10026.1 CRISPR associated protein Cas6 [Tepidibacillus sp. HK-1]